MPPTAFPGSWKSGSNGNAGGTPGGVSVHHARLRKHTAVPGSTLACVRLSSVRVSDTLSFVEWL